MEQTGARLDRRLVLAGCLGLAILSLRLPWDLSYDPWGWLAWGQEITDPVLRFNTETYPSWKPLPVAFTALFSFFDGSAPALWLVTARAGGLVAVVLAYRLGARLGGVIAGAASAAGVVLLAGSLRYFAGGASEPLLIALVLGAIDRHLDGRRGQALMLVFGASLVRPECWPFLLGYALFYGRKGWRRALAAGTLLALVPVLWFVPERVGAGDALHGALLARMSKEAHQIHGLAHPALDAVWHGLALVPAPLLGAAAFMLVLAVRDRRPLELVLGMCALAWIAEIGVLTALGYAGIPRFALPAAALLCVLGGAGSAELVRLAGPRRRALALVAVALTCAPFAFARAASETRGAGGAATRDRLEDRLGGLIHQLGGRARVVGCGRPTTDPPFRTMLAWHLGVPATLLDQVRPPQIAFRTRARRLTGFEGNIRLKRVRAGASSRRLLSEGGWQVLANGRCARLTS
jgi:hypothetical protein